MNYEAATSTLRSFFSAAWSNITPVAYDDVVFTPPPTIWVRYNISHFDGYQASMGSPTNNRFRRVGLINAQVFQPQGKASKEARQKADQIISIFLGKEYQGIHFYDVQAKEIGSDGSYYQINVLIYFRYDTIA